MAVEELKELSNDSSCSESSSKIVDYERKIERLKMVHNAEIEEIKTAISVVQYLLKEVYGELNETDVMEASNVVEVCFDILHKITREE